MRFVPTLTAAALLGGLSLGSVQALAAPALPPVGLLAGDAVEHVVEGRHGHLRYTGRTNKAYRMHRRRNTHRHSNPNARNPEREGYQQQLGNTTNGPRY